jgi:phosphohistidine swiveling domain-containing protein
MTIPQKYQGLLDAAAAGVPVPPTLFLTEPVLTSHSWVDAVNAFLLRHPSDHYVIRSCVSAEDNPDNSMAGHFLSSGKVAANAVKKEIPVLYEQNKARLHQLGLSGEVNLMLQPFYCASWGGVAFLPWKYYVRHVLIDFASGGAESAVEGKQSRSALLSLDPEFPDGLAIPDSLASLKPSLLPVFQKLRSQTTGPSDIEWLLTESGDVVVVQLRTVTREVFSFLPATSADIEAANRDLQAIHPGVWETGGIGESFGNLSPLSASFFQQLFQDVLPELRYIGVSGGPCFFHRLPSGQILINSELEKRYFSFRRWTGALKFGMREPEIKGRIAAWKPDPSQESFNYARILEVFTLWQMASLYFLHREKGKTASFPAWEPQEYELTHMVPAESPPAFNGFTTWDSARNELKNIFLSELRKLKMELFRHSEAAFLSWTQYQALSESEQRKAGRAEMTAYLTPAHFAGFPGRFGSGNAEVSSRICLAGEAEIRASCLVISDPGSWTGRLPEGVIVVAPYFRNEWVPDLSGLAGVILEQGGHLSHSAIVAREQNLPYFIRAEDACNRYVSGQCLGLIPRLNRIVESDELL